MTLVTAVDPGNPCGVALSAGGQPAVTTIRDVTPAKVLPLLDWSLERADQLGTDVVLVMEDQFLRLMDTVARPGRRARATANIKSVIKVVRVAEVFVVLAELRGIRVERVLGSKWQAVGLKGTAKVAGEVKLSTKQRAREAVALRWPEVGRFAGVPDELKPTKVSRLNQHERDAMLMAVWWRGRGM